MPGEGSAIANFVQKGMRIPRRGEIGMFTKVSVFTLSCSSVTLKYFGSARSGASGFGYSSLLFFVVVIISSCPRMAFFSGLTSGEIEGYEDLGYVMSGSR